MAAEMCSKCVATMLVAKVSWKNTMISTTYISIEDEGIPYLKKILESDARV
jgi:hypothetical protein